MLLIANCEWLSGQMHIEERRTIEGRTADSMKAKIRKRDKTNVTPETGNMASANQNTPGWFKFASLVANQLGRVNRHEHACFGLSSPWSLVHPVITTFGHTKKLLLTCYCCMLLYSLNLLCSTAHFQARTGGQGNIHFSCSADHESRIDNLMIPG